MAKRICPVCGKKIAAQAQYCIFCSARFDGVSDTDVRVKEREERRSPMKSALGFVVTLISILIIAIVLLLVFLGPRSPLKPSEPNQETATTVVTTTTRDAARDALRQTYVGYWYDELSAGKDDLKKQGGYVLYIEDIFRDYVTFDLLSYEGGENGKIASTSVDKAVLVDDTLHFTFKDDTLGHSGEGFLRLAEDRVEMEVRVDGARLLPEDEHTLAVYSVFKRRSLPASQGHDLQKLKTIEDLKAVAGKQIKDPAKDALGNTTMFFNGLRAVTNKSGKLTHIVVEYSALDKKDAFCYVCVDGTMTYTTIQTYFGEALHDYVEQPTDIRVLHYALSDKSSITFTFDADTELLTTIRYVL